MRSKVAEPESLGYSLALLLTHHDLKKVLCLPCACVSLSRVLCATALLRITPCQAWGIYFPLRSPLAWRLAGLRTGEVTCSLYGSCLYWHTHYSEENLVLIPGRPLFCGDCLQAPKS